MIPSKEGRIQFSPRKAGSSTNRCRIFDFDID